MVLVAKQMDGVMYAVVSNIENHKTDFIKVDLKTNKTSIKTLNYPISNHHYVFNNKELVQCIYHEDKIEIKTVNWD